MADAEIEYLTDLELEKMAFSHENQVCPVVSIHTYTVLILHNP